MSVLVTVVGSRTVADLELDDARPIADLLESLAVALGEPSPAAGLTLPDGTPVALSATLADAGVLDGHRLRLIPGPDSGSDPPTHQPDAGLTLPAGETAASPVILACYLALDTSDSMVGSALEALNVELARLVDAVRAHPRLAEICRLAVVTFDEEARLHLPLTPVAEIRRPPRLAATRPATNYEVVFGLLRRQITEDLDALRASGRRPLRPAVWLLTDGRPTRGFWPPAHAELTDPFWVDAPAVVAFGFGDASAAALRRIGTAGVHLPASAPGVALRGPAGMLAALVTFLQEALRGADPGAPAAPGRHEEDAKESAALPVPPDAPTGWRSLPGVLR